MKKLTIMRHGKAQSRELPNIADRDRTLEERGRKDSRRVGAFFAGMAPDLILSSPATRALQTATLFAEGAGYDEEIKIDERIYAATSANQLFTVLREQEGDHLLIAGHNPPISALVALLDFLDSLETRSIVDKVNLVTAATAHIVFKELDDWQDLQKNSGQLRALLSPRFVKDL